MLIVKKDPAAVEAELSASRFNCPVCGGLLGRWGHARARWLRDREAPVQRRPRRARCRSCGRTHVLLSDELLLRRVDTAAVIGAALQAAADGVGFRRAAAVVGRPASTVRGWLRRACSTAERIRVCFIRWAHALDPSLGAIVPAASPLGDALEAIGMAARAATLRLGPRPAWSWASALSGGRLLSNTNTPWPQP